jgi:hypothetical protein
VSQGHLNEEQAREYWGVIPDLQAAPQETIVIERGERVYPCRCGQTHRGPQAWADYGHHNCFHDSPLVSMHAIDPVMDENHYLCPDCGKDFWLSTAGGSP